MRYRPCEGCRRHIRDTECPFCGHADTVESRAVPATRGLTRAVIVVGSVATLSVAGCGSVAPAYGGPPLVQEAPPDEGRTQTPPEDGEERTRANHDEPTAPVALYGGAPMQ